MAQRLEVYFVFEAAALRRRRLGAGDERDEEDAHRLGAALLAAGSFRRVVVLRRSPFDGRRFRGKKSIRQRTTRNFGPG